MSAAEAAPTGHNLLALSLQRVRDNAAKQGEKRRLDPGRYSGVKSKVAGNVRVAKQVCNYKKKQNFMKILQAAA